MHGVFVRNATAPIALSVTGLVALAIG